jgi:PKD repeat protein
MIKGNKRTAGRLVLGLALLAAVLPSPPQVAVASHEPLQPALDHDLVDYTPIGYYGPPDEAGTSVGESAMIPTTPPSGPPPAVPGPNPSGKFVSYDRNVWESLHLPSRHPGDNCNSLPVEQRHPDCRAGDMDADNDGPQGYSGPNGTSPVHGECPPQAGFVAGECFNHQLEYLDYFEQEMETLLADFGGKVERYPFQSPGAGLPRGAPLEAAGGQAYNIAAVVPGADHPEETVLVSGHYDFTDSGPAAAWDSAEGHTEVMRMAWIMADYWRKTNTRPSATVKFIPWDSEESGTHGSIDYVRNNIPPGQESKVRGYFNVDPCAGAYPAFKDGNFTERVPEVMQLADPAPWPEDGDNLPNDPNDRIEQFNTKAEDIIDDVFNRLDDRLTTPTGEQPIFVSDAEAAAGSDDRGPVGASQRGEIITNTSGLFLFSSDYANFEKIGVPIFNLFPDMLGPHGDDSDEEAAGRDTTGISILHTPNDNLTRINRLTSGLTTPGNAPDPTGLFASEGWAKGMEFCAQANSWYMLQPEMAGAQTRNADVVAYYEALPNEAFVNENVTFDASETYQYADPTTRELVPEGELTYTWNFGDGNTVTGTGPAFKVVQHPYTTAGTYQSTLTVTGRGGSSDTMTIPVVVILGGPPLPNPVACTEPGVTILTDPIGDVNPQTGNANADDLERLSVAEPRSLPGKVVFTLKMARLTEVPDGRSWNALLRSGPDVNVGTDHVVRMSTFPTGPPQFSVGAPGSTTVNPVVNPGTPADPASSFNADGTIRIVVSKSQIGDPVFLSMFLSRQRIHGGAVDVTPDNMPDDLVRTGAYAMAVPATCNRAPVAVNDTATTKPANPVTINVLANDTDPDGDPLTVTAVTDPPNGTATINADNTVTYRPRCGFTGADSFFYTIEDPFGASDSALVSVLVRRTSRRGSC